MKIDAEHIKKDGAIKALKHEIRVLQYKLYSEIWEGTVCNNVYMGLGLACITAKKHVEQIEELLAALKELEPGNS